MLGRAWLGFASQSLSNIMRPRVYRSLLFAAVTVASVSFVCAHFTLHAHAVRMYGQWVDRMWSGDSTATLNSWYVPFSVAYSDLMANEAEAAIPEAATRSRATLQATAIALSERPFLYVPRVGNVSAWSSIVTASACMSLVFAVLRWASIRSIRNRGRIFGLTSEESHEAASRGEWSAFAGLIVLGPLAGFFAWYVRFPTNLSRMSSSSDYLPSTVTQIIFTTTVALAASLLHFVVSFRRIQYAKSENANQETSCASCAYPLLTPLSCCPECGHCVGIRQRCEPIGVHLLRWTLRGSALLAFVALVLIVFAPGQFVGYLSMSRIGQIGSWRLRYLIPTSAASIGDYVLPFDKEPLIITSRRDYAVLWHVASDQDAYDQRIIVLYGRCCRDKDPSEASNWSIAKYVHNAQPSRFTRVSLFSDLDTGLSVGPFRPYRRVYLREEIIAVDRCGSLSWTSALVASLQRMLTDDDPRLPSGSVEPHRLVRDQPVLSPCKHVPTGRCDD